MTKEIYKYPIYECDIPVERRPILESFRVKRSQWISWLDHDELRDTRPDRMGA